MIMVFCDLIDYTIHCLYYSCTDDSIFSEFHESLIKRYSISSSASSSQLKASASNQERTSLGMNLNEELLLISDIFEANIKSSEFFLFFMCTYKCFPCVCIKNFFFCLQVYIWLWKSSQVTWKNVRLNIPCYLPKDWLWYKKWTSLMLLTLVILVVCFGVYLLYWSVGSIGHHFIHM